MKIYLESLAIIIVWYLIFSYINLSFNPADFTMICWSGKEQSSLVFQVIFTFVSIFVNIARHSLNIKQKRRLWRI